MSRRSVSNDRYRVEQKGKTRKSASAAKPKRDAGVAAGSTPAKKKPAKKGTPRWGRGPSREPMPKMPSSPQMKQLRRYWWILIGTAIVLAVAMIPISKMKNTTLDSVLFGVYAAALGGALYLEFGPLRKARLAAIAEAKQKGGKGSKLLPDPKLAPTGEPESLADKAFKFFAGKPKAPKADVGVTAASSSDDEASAASKVSAAADEPSGDEDTKKQ
jgi:hypothetical protein